MEIKKLQLRIPKDLYVFAKKHGIDNDMSLNQVLIMLVEKHKKKIEKKLDDDKE